MTVNTHRHQTFKPYTPKVYGNKHCRKATLINGALQVCGRTKELGKDHCDQCERHLRTMLDRVPPDAATEPHPWRKPMKL